MAWVSKYNKAYSEDALLSILEKVKKHRDDDCLSSIDSNESGTMRFVNIHELNKSIKHFIKYQSSISVNSRHINTGSKQVVNLFDYFNVFDGFYQKPKDGIDFLIEKIPIIISICDKGDNTDLLVKKGISRFLLEEAFSILHQYFIYLIDAKELSTF